MTKLVLFFFLSLTMSTYGYFDFDKIKKIKINRRAKYPLGINAMLLGAGGHAAISIDYFISPKLNTEIGWGVNNENNKIFSNYFVGGKYHFFGGTISNTTIYLGVFDALNFSETKVKHHFYLPIGVTRIKRNQISWSAELGYQVDKAYFSKSNIWGTLKIGYRFGL